MAAAFFVHRAAGAQTSLEVIPFVGSYLPLVDFGTATRTASQFLPDSKSTYRQSIGVLVGAGLRFNTSPNIAFELTGAYVQSGWTEQQNSSDPNAYNAGYSIPGNVLMTQGRVVFRPRRTNLQFLTGAGYVQRGGRAWDETRWVANTQYTKSNVEGIVGLGTRASATQRLAFDINAELHLASVNKVESGFVVEGLNPFEGSSFQTDLIVTVGVPMKLWTR